MNGIVLAGGFSRRMGKPKALLPYKHTTMIEWLTEQLLKVCNHVTIVTNEMLYQDLTRLPYVSKLSNVAVITDIPQFKGLGPIAGIYSGMVQVPVIREDHWYAVVACDMPYVNVDLIKRMANEAQQSPAFDVVMVQNQPLHAVYHSRTLPYAQMCLETKQLRLQQFLQNLRVHEIPPETLSDEELQAFTNINTPEEYDSLISRYR